jgi:hypothetical protein
MLKALGSVPSTAKNKKRTYKYAKQYHHHSPKMDVAEHCCGSQDIHLLVTLPSFP